MATTEILPKLCCFYTPNYDPMLIRFLSGIKDRVELHLFEQPEARLREGQPGGGTGTRLFKLDLLCQLADQSDKKQIILVTDIDLEFFRPLLPEAESLLADHDIIFQRENSDTGKINIGVIAFRASKVVLEFWIEVRRRVKEQGAWDQRATNEMVADENYINQLGIRVGRFPFQVWNLTQGPWAFPHGKAILVHANCGGVLNKWNGMNTWRPYVGNAPSSLAAELFQRNLHSLTWRFGLLETGVDSGMMSFHADGTIGTIGTVGAANEVRYEVAGRGLLIFGQDGACTTHFDDFFYDPYRQKIMATGRFPMREGVHAKHLNYLIGELAPATNLVKIEPVKSRPAGARQQVPVAADDHRTCAGTI